MYNQARSVVITYDDPHSLGLKGAMARDKGIAGVLMVSTSLPFPLFLDRGPHTDIGSSLQWEMSQDTSDFQLVQSYRNGMGLNPLGN